MNNQLPQEYHPSNLINGNQKITIITGSGVDAEAGLPTFRGEKGYYEDDEATYLTSVETMIKVTSLK